MGSLVGNAREDVDYSRTYDDHPHNHQALHLLKELKVWMVQNILNQIRATLLYTYGQQVVGVNANLKMTENLQYELDYYNWIKKKKD